VELLRLAAGFAFSTIVLRDPALLMLAGLAPLAVTVMFESLLDAFDIGLTTICTCNTINRDSLSPQLINK